MKKLIVATTILFAISLGGITPIASAQTNDTESSTIESLLAQIQELFALVQSLQTQIQTLQAKQGELKEEIKATLQLTRQLREGMRNADVTLLQELLATDSEIYPEGLVTGYFGPLTKAAVKRLQKKAGIEQVGVVGPKTTAQINILLEGAGKSGKVPPGWLISPGIAKKFGFTPEVPEGQKLPSGIAKKLGLPPSPPGNGDGDNGDGDGDEDTTAPIISDVTTTASSTLATVNWNTDETANSGTWYGTSTPVTMESPFLSVSNGDLVTAHELEISDLTASTTYNYFVISEDAAGNTASSSELSFTTLP